MPKSASQASEEALAAKRKREACNRIEQWCMELVPEAIRSHADISVREVVCGDPRCAPIDTAITIVFTNKGGKTGMTGIPMESHEVTQEDVMQFFPTEDVLSAWARGEEMEWPPYIDDDEDDGEMNPDTFPKLRFEIGTRVKCRVSQDSWSAGKIIQLWYREPHWPKMSWAPYKILLDDGRNIFAPGDSDQIIRPEGSSRK